MSCYRASARQATRLPTPRHSPRLTIAPQRARDPLSDEQDKVAASSSAGGSAEATEVGGGVDASAAAAERAMGTVAWTPPEILTAERLPAESTDVYAFGVIMQVATPCALTLHPRSRRPRRALRVAASRCESLRAAAAFELTELTELTSSPHGAASFARAARR